MKQKPKHFSNVTSEQRKAFAIGMGLIAAMFSKVILESEGFIVDYKINGIPISEIKQLEALGIEEEIKLAIKEERFKDAAKLKIIRDEKTKQHDNYT